MFTDSVFFINKSTKLKKVESKNQKKKIQRKKKSKKIFVNLKKKVEKKIEKNFCQPQKKKSKKKKLSSSQIFFDNLNFVASFTPLFLTIYGHFPKGLF